MDQDLDQLLRYLRAAAPERRLARLEHDVWQRLADRDATRDAPTLLQWRTVAVGLALWLGAVVGGAAAAQSKDEAEMAVFSVNTTFAPSTLLEGRL